MKSKIKFTVIVVTILLGVLAGCATTSTMSLTTFRFRCTMQGDDKFNNCDTQAVCAPYSAFLSMPASSSSLDACLAGCQNVYQQNDRINFACSYSKNIARRTCIQYCRSNFSSGAS